MTAQMKKTKCWTIVNPRGYPVIGFAGSTIREATGSLLDLATAGTKEAEWSYWEQKGYGVQRADIVLRSNLKVGEKP
jgi:hypothetical protein